MKDFLVVFIKNKHIYTIVESCFDTKKELYRWYSKNEPEKIIVNIVEL